MHHLALSNVDSDVVDLSPVAGVGAEEQKVAGQELAREHRHTRPVLVVRNPRHPDADGVIGREHQARAVVRIRALGRPGVRLAELAQRERDRIQRGGRRLEPTHARSGGTTRGEALLVLVAGPLGCGQLVGVALDQGLQGGRVALELLEHNRMPTSDVLLGGDRLVEFGTGQPLHLGQVDPRGRHIGACGRGRIGCLAGTGQRRCGSDGRGGGTGCLVLGRCADLVPERLRRCQCLGGRRPFRTRLLRWPDGRPRARPAVPWSVRPGAGSPRTRR